MRDFRLKTDERGNIVVDNGFMTSVQGVFTAGDSVMGASHVVRAISQGQDGAEGIDAYLSGSGHR